ncbi:ATP-binding protein, partial [Fibrobacterota bacterium]
YSLQICDFNKGCTFATLELKGYKNLTLTEDSCAARDARAKVCHYKIKWKPRPGLIRKIRDTFLFRFRDQRAIIQHMEENHNRLQEQYNKICQLYDKLVKSEAKFRAFFENIQDVYFELAPDGTVLEISPSIGSISFYKREDLLKNDIRNIFVNKNAFKEMLQKLESKGRISDHELQISNKDGSIIYCTITSSLIKEEEKTRITGVLRDSTERRSAESGKLKLQEQLRQSEKLQLLGQLAGGIAHDFKNQLFGIAANARLMKGKSANDGSIRDCADNILRAANRSSELTKQLLAFARRGKYQSVAIDMHSTIYELIKLLERTIDKKIHIHTQFNAEKPVVQGDPSQLENALLNLAFNARDAMPKGGTLTLSSENVSLDEDFCSKSEYDVRPGLYVKISVKDDGVGIDDENIKRVFEPFYTTKEMGSGLGLSAVYGTIKEHKGAITIETQTGAGTTVSLFFPSSSLKVMRREKTREMKRLTLSKNLLIVEDEEIVRTSSKAALEDLGFNVVACPNGRSALQYYENNFDKTDLILLDMILPDYDVKDLFAEFQRINPPAKIVLWSAYTFPDTVQSLREKGAIDFIDKGSNVIEFKQRISEIAEELD